jgi:diguanylate cyclase (GGDEF)-like protein
MNSPAGSETLKILVVTEDRALARELSQFLSAVGYQVFQAAEPHLALSGVDAQSPQILLLSHNLASRANWELCRELSDRQSSSGQFKLLLIDTPDDSQLQEALESGIDDFLLLPVCHGELLARLRAAARVLEFDRRVSQQAYVEPLTGLSSRSAFSSQLSNQWMVPPGTSLRVACVVFDIDYFDRINRAHGFAAGNTLLKSIAGELSNLRVGSEILGCLGGNRFCAMLPVANDAAAVEWAERVRQVLVATKFKVGKTNWQITASFGVASCHDGESAEQRIEKATRALYVAKISGRNCVEKWNEFSRDALEHVGLDKVFERTVARDVMTPCTVFLKADEPLSRGVELLERTRLDAIPVVDSAGQLLGLCQKDKAAAALQTDGERPSVGDAITTVVQRFDQRDDFATLMQFFTQDPLALAVVVDDGRPLGILNCDSLLALSRPVTRESLVAKSCCGDTNDYLRVPDTATESCAATA